MDRTIRLKIYFAFLILGLLLIIGGTWLEGITSLKAMIGGMYIYFTALFGVAWERWNESEEG